MTSIAIGSDHAGFTLKQSLAEHLKANSQFEVQDFGAYSEERSDYPDAAHAVAKAVQSGNAKWGVLVCGSGQGVCITANRHKGVRAGLAWNEEAAGLIRAHNNANVICFSARTTSPVDAAKWLNAFLATEFEGGRHEGRVEKIEQV